MNDENKVETTTVTDAAGNELEAEVGIDGENPVTADNPPAKAVYVTEEGDEPEGINGGPVTPDNPPAKAVNYQSPEVGGAFNEDAQPVEDEESEEAEEDGPPAKSALKDEWVDYAVEQGADREEAEASTKDELIAEYGDDS